MARVGTLRPYGLRCRLPLALSMSESALASSFLLAAVATIAAFFAWRLSLIANGAVRVVFALVCVVGAAASIFMADVNIPLAASHLRPSGELVSLWVALVAWAFRVLPLTIPLMSVNRCSRKAAAEGTHE